MFVLTRDSSHTYRRRMVAMRFLALIVMFAGCGDGDHHAAPTPTVTATPVPTATPFDSARFEGVYYGTVGGSRGFAAVTDGITIELMKDPHSNVRLGGALRSDGTAEIRGSGIFQGDIFVELTGQLAVTEVGDVQRISGTIDSGSFSASAFGPFLFERRANHDASVYSSSYRFTFTQSASGCECATTATLTFVVEANGFASSTMPATEFAESSRRVGSFEPGECFVSATGLAQCTLRYSSTFVSPPGEFSLPPSVVGMTFQLPLDDVSGFGLTVPSIFSSFLGGTITIERAPDTGGSLHPAGRRPPG